MEMHSRQLSGSIEDPRRLLNTGGTRGKIAESGGWQTLPQGGGNSPVRILRAYLEYKLNECIFSFRTPTRRFTHFYSGWVFGGSI